MMSLINKTTAKTTAWKWLVASLVVTGVTVAGTQTSFAANDYTYSIGGVAPVAKTSLNTGLNTTGDVVTAWGIATTPTKLAITLTGNQTANAAITGAADEGGGNGGFLFNGFNDITNSKFGNLKGLTDLTINGSNFSLKNNSLACRGLDVRNVASVTIKDLTADGIEYSTNSTTIGANAIQVFSTVAVSDSTFSNNKVDVTAASQTAGGGGLYIGVDDTLPVGNIPTGTTTLTNVSFIDNKIGDSGTKPQNATGGGLSAARMSSLNYTGGIISGNQITATDDGTAVGLFGALGGGMFIGDISTTNINGVTFAGNTALNSNGGNAFGGGLYIDNFNIAASVTKSVTLTDVTFTDNKAITSAGVGTAEGGAIWTDADITIKAVTKDVIFSNNTTQVGIADAVANDIHLAGANLKLEAAATKTISFGGGITGNGDVTTSGFGTVEFKETARYEVGAGDTFTIGANSILKTGMYQDAANVWTSNVTNDLGGDIVFGTNSTWYITSGNNYRGDDIAGITIANADIAKAQAALNLGNSINSTFVYGLDATTGKLSGDIRKVANVSPTAASIVTFIAPMRMTSGLSGAFASFADHAESGNDFRGNSRGDSRNDFRGQVSRSCNPCEPIGACDPCEPVVACDPCEPISCNPCGDIAEEISCNPCNPCEPINSCASTSTASKLLSSKNAWVNWVGRSNEFTTTFLGAQGSRMKVRSNGVQFGTDIIRKRNVQFGVMVGYERHKATMRQDETKGNDLYFGLYGQMLLGNGWDVRGVAGYGQQNYDSRRLETAWNTASIYGDSFESSFEVGRKMRFHKCFSLRPLFALDVTNTSLSNFREVGADALTFSGTTLTQAFLRFGSDATWKRDCVQINGGAFYRYNFAENGDYAKVIATNALGISIPAISTNLGRSAMTFHVGSAYTFDAAKRFSLFGDYTCDFYTDRDGKPTAHTGIAGIRGKF